MDARPEPVRAAPVRDWLDAGGLCQRYALSGHGATTLVLVHEMGGAVESWDAVVRLLGDDHRVLCYDQRGFGLSEKHGELTLDGLVSDLAALLDGLLIDPPVVLAGGALGAAICLAFALRYPQRVAGLVVASPATGGLTAAAAQAMQARMDMVRAHGLRSVTDAMMAMTYPPPMRFRHDIFERHRRRWLTIDPEAFIRINQMMATFDLLPLLPRITCPVQVIGCTYDPIRPPARSQEIAARMPQARYIECASGHYMPIQSPERFAEVLGAFVDGLAGDGP